MDQSNSYCTHSLGTGYALTCSESVPDPQGFTSGCYQPYSDLERILWSPRIRHNDVEMLMGLGDRLKRVALGLGWVNTKRLDRAGTFKSPAEEERPPPLDQKKKKKELTATLEEEKETKQPSLGCDDQEAAGS
ncbi:hypothetical protein NDU88_005300 [Pleurodeles waltl]|uniref:Uncharacterized protein n=1 Tax=Pleurodeles waltl TaxID=8319 RepID=A0AAV7VM98_PLEWA|nr:hypothetical protein NDU88_005300 [Pleurodeles waltl]